MKPHDDAKGAAVAANQGPFIVLHPCPACHGKDGEKACPKCHGTGVGRFFHGTKADLKPGDLIEPGRPANFGSRNRASAYVYLTGTLDAATWGAELALGEGPGRIYMVEPTGPIEDDPNLTDRSIRGIRPGHSAPANPYGLPARSSIGRGTPRSGSRL